MTLIRIIAVILKILTLVFAVKDLKEKAIWKILLVLVLAELISRLMYLGVWSGLTALDQLYDDTCRAWAKLFAGASLLAVYKICIKRCKNK